MMGRDLDLEDAVAQYPEARKELADLRAKLADLEFANEALNAENKRLDAQLAAAHSELAKWREPVGDIALYSCYGDYVRKYNPMVPTHIARRLAAQLAAKNELLNHCISELTQAALSDDGADGDACMDLVEAIGKNFAIEGKTSDWHYNKQTYDRLCAALGVSNEDEIDVIPLAEKAIAQLREADADWAREKADHLETAELCRKEIDGLKAELEQRANELAKWKVALSASQEELARVRTLVIDCQKELGAYIVTENKINAYQVINRLFWILNEPPSRATLKGTP